MCQVCVDNNYPSQETYDKIEAFLEIYPMAAFGPAHIVLDDVNVGDNSIRWCLGLAKAALSGNPMDLWKPEEDVSFMWDMDWYSERDRDTLAATVGFLEELLLTLEEIR
jgi:hypothetical protein